MQVQTHKQGRFEFICCKAPICNEQELSQFDLVLPEMFYGNSYLRLVHPEFLFEFNASDAIAVLRKSEYKVKHAEKWTNNYETLEYNWTFEPNYLGTFKSLGDKYLEFTETEKKIDIELLKKRDPILFFQELVLYEDELGDNGNSSLVVKIRVMETCFLCLLQFYLRIDGVIVRIHDTRLFHSFGTSYLIRESTEREIPYDILVDKLPIKGHGRDLTSFHDTGLISSLIGEAYQTSYQIQELKVR